MILEIELQVFLFENPQCPPKWKNDPEQHNADRKKNT